VTRLVQYTQVCTWAAITAVRSLPHSGHGDGAESEREIQPIRYVFWHF